MDKIERAFETVSPVALLITSWVFFLYYVIRGFYPFHIGKFVIATLFVSIATYASVRTMRKTRGRKAKSLAPASVALLLIAFLGFVVIPLSGRV